MPPQPGAAIVEGAASFGLNPESIRSRRSRLTYGTNECKIFDEKCDRDQKSKRRKFEEQGDYYICNFFNKFVSVGERGDVNKVVKNFRVPMSADQTSLLLTFHSTRKKNPRYVDESDVEKLGELVIDISRTVGTTDRPVEDSMNFGKTEIAVTAKDKKTGKTYNTTLRFSSTYSIE